MSYKYFQLDRVMKDFEGDLQLLTEAYDIYQNLLPEHIFKIRNGIRDEQASVVSNTAHSLKGMIAYFNASDVFRSAELVEQLAKRDGFPSNEISQELDKLVEALEALNAELESYISDNS